MNENFKISKEKTSNNVFFIRENMVMVGPKQNKIVGPLAFVPNSLKNYNCDLYIKSNGKVINHFSIFAETIFPKFEIFYNNSIVTEPVLLNSANSLTGTFELQVINKGEGSELINGIYFKGFTCEYHSYVILNCNNFYNAISGEKVNVVIKHNFDQVEFQSETEIWIRSVSGVFKQKIEFKQEITVNNESFSLWNLCSVLFFVYASKDFCKKKQKLKVFSSFEVSEEKEFDWEPRTYAKPLFKAQKILGKKESKNAVGVEKEKKIQGSLVEKLMINISKSRHSDEYTVASVTTDTRLNSPANSQTEEILEMPLEDDFYLDNYKISGIFAIPQIGYDNASLNLEFSSIS